MAYSSCASELALAIPPATGVEPAIRTRSPPTEIALSTEAWYKPPGGRCRRAPAAGCSGKRQPPHVHLLVPVDPLLGETQRVRQVNHPDPHSPAVAAMASPWPRSWCRPPERWVLREVLEHLHVHRGARPSAARRGPSTLRGLEVLVGEPAVVRGLPFPRHPAELVHARRFRQDQPGVAGGRPSGRSPTRSGGPGPLPRPATMQTGQPTRPDAGQVERLSVSLVEAGTPVALAAHRRRRSGPGRRACGRVQHGLLAVAAQEDAAAALVVPVAPQPIGRGNSSNHHRCIA